MKGNTQLPTPATVVAPASSPRGRAGDRQIVATVPFIRASGEHVEPAGIDISRLMTAGTQDLGVQDVPAYGFLRALSIVVTATGGVGAATAHEDAPFNVLQNIALTEPNGAQIAAFNSGFDLYLAHKWGGYGFIQGADPKASPVYTAVTAAGDFAFLLRIPVELNARDGLGSLPNQNSGATFKLRMTLAASTTVYTTPPATTLPTVRVRVYQHAWDQPNPSDGNAANQTQPPAVNTTQFWSTQTYPINVGSNNIRLTRVGNYLRNLIFVLRRGGTSRTTGHGDFPDPAQFNLDARPTEILERNVLLHQMHERTGFGGSGRALDSALGLNAGVFVRDFTHDFDGSLGMENRDLWQPTLGSTRFELTGSFPNAGTLTVITNDVAVAGTVFM
jgi:hypothetical protein